MKGSLVMDAPERPDLPRDAFTLPARFYIDPDHFRAELECFFAGMWVCAGRTEEIPGAGDYVLRDIGEESVILVRDGDGVIRAFFNVCRHRGTRLRTEAEGRFPQRIQCPYHAWTYDLQGRLAAAPHMDGDPRFRREDYPLRSLGVGAWDGHLFVHLGDDPEPLEAQLADLPEKFRAWGMGGLRRAERIVYDVRANWKLIVQNYSECLHCPIIHPALNRLSHYLSGVNEPTRPRPTYLGGRMELRDGVETLSNDGRLRRRCLPGLDGDQRRQVHYYSILPNLLLSLHPDYLMTHTLWPRACDQTTIVCEWHFHPDELAQPGFDPSDAVGFWDTTNRQDWHVSELSQLGLRSRAYAPGPYSCREDLLYAFDRAVLERMGGMAPSARTGIEHG
jgi:Rieske 2Fe-2S family protein